MPRAKASLHLQGRTRRRGAVGVSSATDRVAQRAAVGPLRDRLVQPATLRAYRAACTWFFTLVGLHGMELGQETWEFDELLGDCIELAWETGLPRNLIGNLLSGLEHFVNGLRGQLRGSWRLWRVWGAHEVPARAPPLSVRATLGLAYHMWSWGYRGAAVLTCIAFDRFLRTMEFLSLTPAQLTFDDGLTRVHIQLPWSKGSSRRGTVEAVVLTDSLLAQLLHGLVRNLLPGDCVVGMSSRDYRLLFDRAIHVLELRADFKPYSLRRGGATHHFRRWGNMSWTMDVGRWSDTRTAKVYVNSALLALTDILRLETPCVFAAAEAFLATFA